MKRRLLQLAATALLVAPMFGTPTETQTVAIMLSYPWALHAGVNETLPSGVPAKAGRYRVCVNRRHASRVVVENSRGPKMLVFPGTCKTRKTNRVLGLRPKITRIVIKLPAEARKSSGWVHFIKG
jgi:hypothetical protein